MTCKHCKKEFNSSRSYQVYCTRECRAITRPAYLKEWREKNREYKKEVDKKYYYNLISTPEGLEKDRTRKREWYRAKAKAIPHYARDLFRKKYRNDPEFRERTRKYVAEYAKTIPEKIRVWNMNYIARKKNAEGTFTTQEWEDILKRNNYKCLMCGTKDRISIDHIIPLSKGGTNYIENIQPLCLSCNCRKSNKILPKSVMV